MKKMQFLLILFFPLFGQILCSPLDKQDMELLDMIFRDGDESDISRSQRELPPSATSIACDENSSEEDYPPIFAEDESDEDCLDLLPPIEHPCFMRLILLRTPLLKQDPCANFSIAIGSNKKTKSRKCLKRTRTEIRPNIPDQRNTSTNSTQSTSTKTEILAKTPPTITKTLGILPSRKEIINPTETTTLSSEDSTTTDDPTTTEDSTTTDDSTIAIEEDFTTTTDIPTTLATTTPVTTSTTRNPNQLKSFRTNRRNRKSKKPRVPDPPKIKLDAATQPSEVIQVIFTTEMDELRRQSNDTITTPTTTTTIQPDITTEVMEATTNEVERTTEEMEVDVADEMERTETEETKTEEPVSKAEEPCNDTDEQDTNLCPRFMTPPDESRPLPPMQVAPAPPQLPQPPQRYRKPIKNYVEPILYEGHFAKPRQRIGLMPQTVQQQRDYFFTNKQIMPKPKPKYRKRLPPSIYMNNIVRGLKCIDLPPALQNRNLAPLQPGQHYWGVKRITSKSFAPTIYRHQQRYRVPATPAPPSTQSPSPFTVPVALYQQHTESEEDCSQENGHIESERSYFDNDKSDLWSKFGSSNSNVDPCQLEHDHLELRQQHEQNQHQHKPQHQDEDQQQVDHQSADFGQQQIAAHFFT